MPCCNVAFIVPFFHSLTQEFAGCCMRLLIACGTAGFSTSSSCFFICSASTLALSDPSFCLNCFSFTGAHSYFFFVPLPLLIFILYMFFFFFGILLSKYCKHFRNTAVELVNSSMFCCALLFSVYLHTHLFVCCSGPSGFGDVETKDCMLR